MRRGRRKNPDGYVIQVGGYFKFGLAVDVENRLNTYMTSNPHTYLLRVFPDRGRELEEEAKYRFERHRLRTSGRGNELYRPHPDIVFWLLLRGAVPRPIPEFLYRFGVELLRFMVVG